jgi:hypothetical protein
MMKVIVAIWAVITCKPFPNKSSDEFVSWGAFHSTFLGFFGPKLVWMSWVPRSACFLFQGIIDVHVFVGQHVFVGVE